MAIDSYAKLKTSIASWLDRDDLTDNIPDFISLAEDRINRHIRVRSMEHRAEMSTVANQEYYGLPDGYIQMRHFALKTSPIRDLSYLTPERFDTEVGGTVGRPKFYTLVGNEIRIGPKPGGVYTLEMVFYEKFSHLSDSHTSNKLLEDHSDLLLYGALLEAEPFVKNPESAQMWGLYFNQAIDAIATADEKDRHSGGALAVRSDHRGI
jgi:hypothetical protein